MKNLRQHASTNYKEGSWIAIPLSDNSCALGLVARIDEPSFAFLGYFFGSLLDVTPTANDTLAVSPADSVLIAWVSALGIVDETWSVIESPRPFNKDEWPVPKFALVDIAVSPYGTLVEYDQSFPRCGKPVRESLQPAVELVDLPRDGLYGHKALEAKLVITVTKR